MSLTRIPEYPIFQPGENVESYVRRLRDRLQDEATDRLRDHAFPHTDIKMSAYLSADQENITDSTITTVQLDTESYDVAGNFDTATYTFTAPQNGYYLITAQVAWKTGTVVADKIWGALLYNGATGIATAYCHSSNTGALRVQIHRQTFLESGNTVLLKAYHEAGVNTPDIRGDSVKETYMSIHLLSV